MLCDKHKDESTEGREICLFCELSMLNAKVSFLNERNEMLVEQLEDALQQRDNLVKSSSELLEKATALDATVTKMFSLGMTFISKIDLIAVTNVLKMWQSAFDRDETREDTRGLLDITSEAIILMERNGNEEEKGKPHSGTVT